MAAFQDNFPRRDFKQVTATSHELQEHGSLSEAFAVNLQIKLKDPSDILREPVPEIYYASLSKSDRLKWWSELKNTRDAQLIKLFRPLLLEEKSPQVLDLALQVSLPHLTAWDLPIVENILRFRAPEAKNSAQRAIEKIEERHGKLPKGISAAEAALWSTWHDNLPLSSNEMDERLQDLRIEVYDICAESGLALQIDPQAKRNQVDISRVDGVLTLQLSFSKARFDQPAKTQLMEQYAIWSIAKFSVGFDSKRDFIDKFVKPYLSAEEAIPVILSLRKLSTELAMFHSGLSDLNRAPRLSLQKQAVLGFLSSQIFPRSVMPNLRILCEKLMPEVAPLIQPITPQNAEYLGTLGFIPTHLQRVSTLSEMLEPVNIVKAITEEGRH